MKSPSVELIDRVLRLQTPAGNLPMDWQGKEPGPSSVSRRNPAGSGLSWSRLSNQSIAVYYSLPRASAISLGIYDVKGDLVRVLADKTKEAGNHVAVWDRRDGRGNYLSGGIYCLRLTRGRQTLIGKMVLLR